MTSAPPFNWLTALESAVKGGLTPNDRCLLYNRAAGWPTCACGDLCKDLPRWPSGRPMDKMLGELGCQFTGAVALEHWHEALATFRAIEARTAELLAEKAKQIP